MSRNQLPRIFPWLSLKSPKKQRVIFKRDIDTNKRRKLIFNPPEENKPPEVDLSEIREVVNNLVNNVDKLLQDDLECSDQIATQFKMTQEIEEFRKQLRCLQKELKQLKTKPKFDIDKHKDSDDDVAFFTGFPSYDVMLFCLSMRLRLGLLEKDLAQRFCVAVSTVFNICRTWIRFMRAERECICIHWPYREQVFHYMPPIFKKLYPSLG